MKTRRIVNGLAPLLVVAVLVGIGIWTKDWIMVRAAETQNKASASEQAEKPTQPPQEEGQPAEKINFAFSQSLVQLWPQEKEQHIPVFSPASAAAGKITFSSSNPNYVRVDSKGFIRALNAGSGKKATIIAEIQLKDGTIKKSSYQVKVHQTVKQIKLSIPKDYVLVGKKRKITAKVLPDNAEKKTIEYTSSNTDYATVSATGVVTPKKAGAGQTVIIKAVATDGDKAAKSVKLRIIDPNQPMVALTFDDGPSGERTKRLVKVLKKYDARATFFVVGNSLGKEENQEAMKLAYKNHNEIASHTYSHKQLTKISLKSMKYEISRTEKAIKSIIGVKPALMRAPYGAVNSSVKAHAGTPIILWDIDTRDWATRNAVSTYKNVINHAKDGDIILMHDIHTQTIDAAVKIIPKLKEKGYQMVTVSELAEYKGIKLKDGAVYFSIR